MDRIETPIESSFMGLVRRAQCPLCGETLAVNFGFTSLMLCPNCGGYLEVVGNMLRQMDTASISAIPAFAAPTPWADMHAPRFETISFYQWDDLVVEATEWALTEKAGARVLDAKWPGVCCVCGAPPTREETTAQRFIFTPPGLIRVRSKEATIVAAGIPHCSEHEHGAVFERAMFSTPEQTTVVGLFFRSYAYQIQFRKLNPWRWTDEGERQTPVSAAAATPRRAARWKLWLPLGLGVAAIILFWRPFEGPEPSAPPPSQSPAPNLADTSPDLSPEAVMPAPEPPRLESLLDDFHVAPGGQIEAEPLLRQFAIPLEAVSFSPSSGRLLFLDSDSIGAFRDSALGHTNLLALVVAGNVPAELEFRFAEPVAEVRLSRPEVDHGNLPDRTLMFPALTVSALDGQGQVIDEPPLQPEWRSDGTMSGPEPPREIILRAPGSEGIRSVRMRASGPIHREGSFPICPMGLLCPIPATSADFAAIILSSIQARRMPPLSPSPQ